MKILAAAASALLLAGSASAAVTVQTTDFLSGYTNYNGFEATAGAYLPANTPYTEDGITVEYVGDASIWTSSQAAEGSYSWYPSGGGYGYTKITFGGVINAVEFQGGSGWSDGNGLSMQYEVLNGGSVIATGSIGGVSTYTGFKYYGFSGAAFDEIRLQVQPPGYTGGFGGRAYEAGAYDAINFGGTVAGVPEPASWAMLITGFGMVGFAARRRRTAVTA